MPEPNPFPSIKTPWGSATPPSGAGPAAGMRDLPPIPVPDHTLIRRVGKGSYGEVWLARNVLGVHRAVKIIDRRAFDDDRPFEREFAGIQRFEPVSRTHESQLNILHVGRGPDCFYYVMELADDMGDAYASGGTSYTSPQSIPPLGGPSSASPQPSPQLPANLQRGTPGTRPSDTSGGPLNPDTYTPRTLRSELLLRGRLPVDECIRLGLALTTALGHLHRHGLVHRDIKPSNIVFVKGIPKLADIGLVARAEATMSFVGTEGYLPPEGPGTVQADVFSLGKVLYEISTGHDRQQFPELPTGITELPDRAALAELNEVLLRACAPDVRQRYASAAEMHADLALLQSGKSVARMRAVERRLKFVVRAAAVVAGLAVLAGAAFFYQQVQTREARRLSGENLALAGEKSRLAADKSKLAEANREQLVRLRVANGNRLLDEGDPSAALLWLADALPLVSNKPAEETIHRIRIQQTLDQTPRLLQVLPHDSALFSSAYSPDGRFIATGTLLDGKLTVWDAASGSRVWGPKTMGRFVGYVRFSRDGERLFACSSRQQAPFDDRGPMPNFFAVLDARSGREVFSAAEVLPGMSTNLQWSSFSPDDRWLAVSQQGSVVRVLDLRDGHLVTELRGHQKDVWFLSFSADGNLLASASADKTVRLWRLPSGEPVGPPLEHRLPVMRAILTDDGRHLVTGSLAESECEIQAWDVLTGRRVGNPLKADSQGIDATAIFVEPGAGGRFFGWMGRGKDNFTRAWHFDSFREALPTLEIAHAQCWAFSPDGKRLAIGGDDGTALVWALESGKVLRDPIRHDRWLDSVQFSPDGQSLLTASADGNARVWDMKSFPTESARVQMPGTLPTGPAESFRARGHSPGPVPVPLQDGTMLLVDPDSLKELFRLKTPHPDNSLNWFLEGISGHCWAMNTASVTNDGPTTVLLLREEAGALQKFSLEHPGGITRMRFTPDDGQLVTCGNDHFIRFWRTTDGTLDRTVEAPKSEGQVVTISPDTKIGVRTRVMKSTPGDVVECLDLDSGKIIGAPYTLTGPIIRPELSPDGNRLALADPNGPVTVLDVPSGKVVASGIKHTRNLVSVEWSPDGRRLLTAGNNEEILVWDAVTGTQLLAPLSLPKGDVRVAHWSPDGRFIIGRSDKRQARVWDADTGEAVTPLLKHSGDIRFAFMTRSHRLITASDPDLLRAWDLKPTLLTAEVIADYARLLSGRRLNASGVLLPVKASELAELSRSLRARAPQLFE